EFEKRGVSGAPLDPATIDVDLVDLFASFQRAIVDALLERVEAVHRTEGIERLALSGGVAANSELRARLTAWGEQRQGSVLLAARALTPDNAAMIAWAGWLRHGREGPRAAARTPARSRWPLGT